MLCMILVFLCAHIASVVTCQNNARSTYCQITIIIFHSTVIPRLTKIIRYGITFVSRNIR